MAVEQLGRIAHRIRGDGVLALEVELPGGLRREDHLKVEPGEEGEPEGQVFVHVQAKGDADAAPGAVALPFALQSAELLVFIGHQIGVLHLLLAQGAGAAVAREEAPPAVEQVDGEGAVVGAQVAGDGLCGVGKGFQSLGVQQGGALQPQAAGGQGGPEGPHQPGDGGPGHVAAQLLFEGPQHRVVEEGAALDHDVPAQVVGVGGPDDLVDGVFYDGDGQAGGDVLHTGPILLGLFDAGVHEHGAPGAQVHRMLGKKAQPGELCDLVAQGPGEGLDEGAAAGGTGLVEHDGVHRAVADLKALHVLTADVDDEVHVGLEVGGGVVVGHGLHQSQVAAEGVFDQVLAVAGDGRAPDDNAAPAQGVDLLELVQHHRHGVAPVGLIIGVQQAAVGGDEGQLGGGAPGVDAQVGAAGIGAHVHLGGMVGVVPGQEGVKVGLAGEQGGHGVHRIGGVHALLQLFQQFVEGMLGVVRGAQGRADAGEAVPVGREDGVLPVQMQGLHEPLPQAVEEVQRAA